MHVAARSLEYVLAAQSVQVASPPGENFPAAHGKHAPPFPSEYVPAGQAKQEMLLGREYVPAAHGEQVEPDKK